MHVRCLSPQRYQSDSLNGACLSKLAELKANREMEEEGKVAYQREAPRELAPFVRVCT